MTYMTEELHHQCPEVLKSSSSTDISGALSLGRSAWTVAGSAKGAFLIIFSDMFECIVILKFQFQRSGLGMASTFWWFVVLADLK